MKPWIRFGIACFGLWSLSAQAKIMTPTDAIEQAYPQVRAALEGAGLKIQVAHLFSDKDCVTVEKDRAAAPIPAVCLIITNESQLEQSVELWMRIDKYPKDPSWEKAQELRKALRGEPHQALGQGLAAAMGHGTVTVPAEATVRFKFNFTDDISAPGDALGVGRLAFALTRPKRSTEILKQAWQEYMSNRNEEVLKLVDEAKTACPYYLGDADLMRVRVMESERTLNDALKLLDQVVAQESASRRPDTLMNAYISKARILRAKREDLRALDAIRSARKVAPRPYTGFRQTLALEHMELAFMFGLYPEALEAVSEARTLQLEDQPEEARFDGNLAESELFMALAQKMIRADAPLAELSQSLANGNLASSDPAAQWFRSVARYLAGQVKENELRRMAQLAGDDEEADRRNASADFYVGMLLLAQGKRAEAKHFLERISVLKSGQRETIIARQLVKDWKN